MTINTEQPNLSFEQILLLIKQLPLSQKIAISQELEKEAVSSKLTELLKCFKTEELSLDTITEEVEAVRAELYDRRRRD